MFEIFLQKPKMKFRKKQFGVILEKDILFGEKKFSKEWDWQRPKEKNETRRRRKMKGSSQRDEKREW